MNKNMSYAPMNPLEVQDLNGDDWMNAEHLTGTTIMAVEFDGGVVIGADSRTTTGAYIANRVTDKLTPLHDRIFCCRSGSAADTQAIAQYVKYYLSMHAIELGDYPLVKTASAITQDIIYKNKNALLASMIVAGWDPANGGQVYSIPLGGTRIRKPWTIGGSGSSFIYGYCDSAFRENMTKEECLEFVRNAVSLAMARDGSSGGCIRTLVITEEGLERDFIPGNRLPTPPFQQ
eukprot:TRINITY_DN7467_c0_g1_i1.p1 TRINITY_DN7467_c0_g1~~TRINITY_DN7467_c0_g1_i1.p1  ORF type:complete len:233 (+),score=62.07 TRINITY_DN7467_c0_g1_i1:13-711(+)